MRKKQRKKEVIPEKQEYMFMPALWEETANGMGEVRITDIDKVFFLLLLLIRKYFSTKITGNTHLKRIGIIVYLTELIKIQKYHE
jgi:hypothetical protein